ncbi:hypothetical protein [Delftia tsuruhatensis]|uniref:hypothetical protein n=1 Tax=Delftia tsuruhatensis TaxID=180282 RepID=UPI002260E9B8|nr:hypothetical protein [Delftia tsuruhatensis]MCX7504285.1 hypothetical protein [Delftia tsuruhatensis]
MSGYFICTQPGEMPCQPGHQVAVTEVTVQDLAALGVTPQSISTAVGLGFGVVFALAMLGFVPGVVMRLIRRL